MSKRSLTDSMENMPSKTKKYVCKFNSAWIGEFKCVKHSEKEESFAYRTACNTHLNSVGKWSYKALEKYAAHWKREIVT